MKDHKFKLGVLVSGRGSNLQALIESIEKGELNAKIALVISDKKAAEALERCKQYNIDSLFVDPKSFSTKNGFELVLIDSLREKSIELVCLAGFMRILGETFLNAFPRKVINIHPSLLPSFPGLNAQKQALDYAVKFTGCTVHYVDKRVDTGPIIAQQAVPVHDKDTVETLSQRILKQEHLLYPKAIQKITNHQTLIYDRKIIFDPRPNDEKKI